jgi:hypothetical protein
LVCIFSEVYTNFYEYLKFTGIFELIKRKSGKGKNGLMPLGPKLVVARLGAGLRGSGRPKEKGVALGWC